MNARDYLAKQGVELDREEVKPSTLEEMAWARAREAGQHRPRSGTPYDWQEWERYHGQLAKESGSIGQKIDAQAHRSDKND
jgi:hypothetical protein